MSGMTFQQMLESLHDEHSRCISALEQENANLRGQIDALRDPRSKDSEQALGVDPEKMVAEAGTQLNTMENNENHVMCDSEKSRKSPNTARPLAISPLPETMTRDLSSRELAKKNLSHAARIVESPQVELLVAFFILLSTAIMAWELQVLGENYACQAGFKGATSQSCTQSTSFFVAADRVFTVIFTLELGVRIAILRRQFFKFVNILDIFVVAAGILDWVASGVSSINPMMIRLIRCSRIGRGLRVVKLSRILEALQLLIKCLSASVNVLFWSLFLLLVIQCISSLFICQLVAGYIQDSNNDFDTRVEIFRYYGTFTRSILTMFEVTMANWAPPCRLLVNNISERYSLFFILYRCFIGFACLNVINAVFIQQTMGVAAQDKDIMLMHRERALADHSKKMSFCLENCPL